MTKDDQSKFYIQVGRALTVARERRRMSIAQLSTKSGEHHNTIRGIEAGKLCSLHHAVWMKNILGVDLNEIIRDMEGSHDKKEIRIGNYIDPVEGWQEYTPTVQGFGSGTHSQADDGRNGSSEERPEPGSERGGDERQGGLQSFI